MNKEERQIAALIEGCRSGKEASQMALYRHFYSYGLSICLRYCSNRESALEVLNDGFLKVFIKIDQFDQHQSFKPWLRKVLIHASIDHHRKYKQVDTENISADFNHPTTYNEALDQLDYKDLIKITQALSPAYRMVFNLFVVEGFSHQEIAAQLGISVGASKSNLAKAKKKVKLLVCQFWDISINSKN
jgi:RNA polymerase sigma-70 factor (ECF subfamily)